MCTGTVVFDASQLPPLRKQSLPASTHVTVERSTGLSTSTRVRTASYAVTTPSASLAGAATGGSAVMRKRPVSACPMTARRASAAAWVAKQPKEVGVASATHHWAPFWVTVLTRAVSVAPAEVIGVTVTGVVVTAFVVPLRTASSGRRSSVVAPVLSRAALK